MTERLTLQLHEPAQAHVAFEHAWRWAKAMLIAGHKLTLQVRPQTRSLAQNAMLHAMLQDVAEQIEWAGSKHDAEVWKRLLTAAWLRARGEQLQMLPALDGHGVDIVFRRTSRMSRAELSELCDYIAAWGGEHDVRWTDAVQEQEAA